MAVKKLSYVIIGFVAFFALVAFAFTQEKPAAIAYPVTELNNCRSRIECQAFCNRTENITSCVTFAERNNLISHEEANQARQFGFSVKTEGGPGGCRSQATCEAYCNTISHIQECIAFSEKHNMIGKEELKEAKQVLKALEKGIKLPGSCQNKQECEAYCKNPNHIEECLTFAEAADLFPSNELKNAKQVLSALKKGAKVPACRGKEECDIYCSEETHFEECITFAEKAGFISSEEAVIARKVGNKGPGNCSSKETCEAYCQEPAHQRECFNFAKERGLIPTEQLQQIEEGRARLEEGLRQAQPEALECLKNAMGTDLLEKFRSGELIPGPQIGEQVQKCFEEFKPQPPPSAPPMTKPIPEPRSRGETVCIQVITPAIDSRTGTCREFPTPCDVPVGWRKVESCQQQGTAPSPLPATKSPIIEGKLVPSVANFIMPCLVQKFGQEVVDLFVKGQRVPSAKDIQVFQDCIQELMPH